VVLQRKAAENTAVATDGHITVVLDTQIDAALRREGLAREFTSLVQNARKDSGLEVTDRIALTYDSTDTELLAALEEQATSIQRETLALSLTKKSGGTPTKLNGIDLEFGLTRVTPSA
jgi:isoleucyl-tRNA synthetase